MVPVFSFDGVMTANNMSCTVFAEYIAGSQEHMYASWLNIIRWHCTFSIFSSLLVPFLLHCQYQTFPSHSVRITCQGTWLGGQPLPICLHGHNLTVFHNVCWWDLYIFVMFTRHEVSVKFVLSEWEKLIFRSCHALPCNCELLRRKTQNGCHKEFDVIIHN